MKYLKTFEELDETLQEYIDRIGIDNIPKPKFEVGRHILTDMGDGTKEALTVFNVKKSKAPKGNFEYHYYPKEYINDPEWGNMVIPEYLIIKPLTEKEYKSYIQARKFKLI